MKLLLTGGTGYIGSHAAVAFAEAGHDVVLCDNLSNSRADVGERVSRITAQAIPFVQGDLPKWPAGSARSCVSLATTTPRRTARACVSTSMSWTWWMVMQPRSADT